MNREITRRAFLLAGVGAAAVGWVWLRDGPAATDTAASTTSTSTAPPPTSATSTTTTTTTSTTTTTTTAAPLPGDIQALCREAWGAAAPVGEFRPHVIERLTVHHTARLLDDNREAPAAVRGHQRFHQLDRGWPDIAYHFIIDLAGNVYECRPTGAVGDTGTNYDPTGHFLVCCEGDFDQQALPAAQRAALVNVLAWAAVEFGVDPETIRGHRDVAATSCPGDNLHRIIASGELAAAVADDVASGGITMEVVCGSEAAERIAAIVA